MKKRIFSAFLACLMVTCLMFSIAGCSGAEDEDTAAYIAELEASNAALRAQVDDLTAQLETMQQRAALQDWGLDAAPWNDGNGATVTFTAVPVTYTDGMRAALSVRMGDLEAEGTNCNWDGSAFVGSVELTAADGYSYYCILTSPDGQQQEIALNSPENVTNETLVYLGTSLAAYANLVVEEWEATDTVLTLKSGYVQVQMPQLSAAGAASVTKSALVLKLNGEELERQSVELAPSETSSSYELTLADTKFAMPQSEDDFQLDLYLEVSMSNGNTMEVAGGSWYSNNGELVLVVG